MKDTRELGHLLFDLAVAMSFGAFGTPFWGCAAIFLLMRALAWLKRTHDLLSWLVTVLVAQIIASPDEDSDAMSTTRANGCDAS